MDESMDQSTAPDRDVSGLLEFIAEEAESEAGQGPDGQTDDQQTVDKSAIARSTARSLVGWLQTIFGFFVPGFIYAPEVYDQSEEKLAPMLEKYGAESAGPLKYAPEVDAIGFGFGLVYSGMKSIKNKAGEEEIEPDSGASTLGNDADFMPGGSDGEPSEPFSTQ